MTKGADEARAALMAPDIKGDPDDVEELDNTTGIEADDHSGDPGETGDVGDDSIDDVAVDETQSEATEGEGGDWSPPSREDFEALQRHVAMLEELAGPELEKMLAQREGDDDTHEDDASGITQEQIANMLKPKTFVLTPEVRNKILADGDGDALEAAFTSFAEVLQHNSRIDMNKAVLNGIQYALPVMMATGKIYEKHPELLGMREVVERHLWQIRQAVPQANELQMVRMAEQRLDGMIKMAKKIAAEHAQRKTKPTNLAATPSGGGQATNPRVRTTGASTQTKLSTADRLAELAEHAGATTY